MHYPKFDKYAAGIPDEVRKLRYLRTAVRRGDFLARCRTLRRTQIARGAGLSVLMCAMLPWSGKRIGPVAAMAAVAPVPASSIQPGATQAGAPRPGKVWIAERKPSFLVYSDGLQVRTDYQTESSPRRYRAFSRHGLAPSGERSAPAGIVFHTSESRLLPMEEQKRRGLLETRENLLDHVRRNRLYNFVIDRFGQVFRIVPESEVAYHAGHSIWADGNWIYCGLNESFIGISFEARTEEDTALTDAQIHSGRMLTSLLRAFYGIPESNCVTHAQVSVNPENMRIGFHTDWAARFPFEKLGLSNGYDHPLAAIELFGFEYDQHFLRAIGGTPWKGLTASESALERNASNRGLSLRSYRALLHRKYQQIRRESNERTGNSDRA